MSSRSQICFPSYSCTGLCFHNGKLEFSIWLSCFEKIGGRTDGRGATLNAAPMQGRIFYVTNIECFRDVIGHVTISFDTHMQFPVGSALERNLYISCRFPDKRIGVTSLTYQGHETSSAT